MHRNSQSNDYRSCLYPAPSSIKFAQNTYYQYYDYRLLPQQSLYSNTTARFQQYQISTTISDLAEPVSVFDDFEFPRPRRSKSIPFPSVYVPPNATRRILVNDTRLTTVNAMRERLLINIQHNITEIDQELFSLRQRPSMPRCLLSHLSSIDKKSRSSNDDNQMWSNKPKRIYDVIPCITSESKITPQHSTLKLTHETNAPSYIGQYHYGPEVEETEIVDNDPENSDLELTTAEISRFSFHETFSLNQFRREQSALPQNRALIFVPEYVDNNKNQFNETTKDIDQNGRIKANIAKSSIVKSSEDFASNKLKIKDFELFNQKTPESKTELPSQSAENPAKFSHKTEADLTNTMSSKPIKHSRRSTTTVINIKEELSSSQQTTIPSTNKENNMDGGYAAYPFSNSENAGGSDQARLSVNPKHFAPTTKSKIIATDISTNHITGQSQASLSKQQFTIANNNENVKDTKCEKNDATTKSIITATSTLLSSSTTSN